MGSKLYFAIGILFTSLLLSSQSLVSPICHRDKTDEVNMQRPYKTETIFKSLVIGNSASTEPDGIVSEVIEVNSLSALLMLRKSMVEGKIVFLNHPIDHEIKNNLCIEGPNQAAILGAIGMILPTNLLDSPKETFDAYTRFDDDNRSIPVMAIDIDDAAFLSFYLLTEPVQIYIKTKGCILK